MLDDFNTWIQARAPQVNYSARILHQELCKLGYEGSYETVKLAVRPIRAQASIDGLTQGRFETGPGEQAQVDWGELTVGACQGSCRVHHATEAVFTTSG
jgi:transposase